MLWSTVFTLMDTHPGGLATFWLELSQGWRSSYTRVKSLDSCDGGVTLTPAKGHRANLTTYGLLEYRFIDFSTKMEKEK